MVYLQVCGHKWVDISEYDWGVAVLNDSKYGHSVHKNEMWLSLLRSPKSPDNEADMGWHEVHYALMPHKGKRIFSLSKCKLRFVSVRYRSWLMVSSRPQSL